MKRNYHFNTDLYCITAEELSMGRSNIEVVKEMIAAGVKIIQYREKDKKMKDKYSECCTIREMTKEAGVTFIVNDDIDLAMIVQADGVHIGQDDLPLEKVRELVGDKMIIGISTHCPGEAQQAVRSGADYIGVGPIFKTATKKDVCDPVGFEYLEYVAQNIPIPFVAIGGIKINNISDVMKRGTECIAIITEITTAKDIPERISLIKEVIKNSIVEEK
ncbi:MAG: Thiamine-phosphate pyrophosphorylase [Firmicutes bacterium]|nr:Thiamine-phosphate pyrophosphorylase [Bacillota bacterium]